MEIYQLASDVGEDVWGIVGILSEKQAGKAIR